MNYQKSVQILTDIKDAKNILISCHRGPDSDSVGSALALYNVIKNLGIEATIICPSDIPHDLTYLENSNLIVRVNFVTFDFSKYDLYLIPDSSNYAMVTGLKDSDKPSIKSIVIDHHYSNEKFGNINLIDPNISSTGELLYKIFKDWNIDISSEVAECLLTGIIGDTGTFQYPNVGIETLTVAVDLMNKGADKDKIIFNLYRNIEFKEIKMWGKFIEQMKIEDGFVWSAIPISVYKDFGDYLYAKEDVANLFFPIVKDTRFGIVMVETSENLLSVSFRSRKDFDVSVIAKELGGGGHKAASGVRLEGIPFQEAVNKVLAAARKYAEKG